MNHLPQQWLAQGSLHLTETPVDNTDYREQGERYYEQYKDPRQGANTIPLAINAFIRASEMDNEHHDVVMARLARLYTLNGDFSKAERVINNLKPKANTLEKEALRSLLETEAFLAFRKGRVADAQGFLKQGLALEAFWKRSKFHFALLGVALEHLHRQFSFTKCIAALYHLVLGVFLLPFNPNNSQYLLPALQFRWLKFVNRFASRDKALGSYLAFYQKYPGMEDVYTTIGNIYFEDEQFTEAEFWFQQGLNRFPSKDDGYRSLATVYQVSYNTERLADILSQWLTVRPNNGEILATLSRSLSEDPEKVEQAIQVGKSALMYLSDSYLIANTYTLLGNLYLSLQQPEAAILAYQSALHMNPHCLDTYVQLGTVYYERGDYQLSQQVFEEALVLSFNNAKILCNLGYLAWMQEDVTKAKDYYHRSVAMDPSYDIALNNLGVLYLDHVGDVEQAMQYFYQTLTHNPEYALCHYNLGRANSFLGNTVEAARCFQIAQELNKETNELDNQELTDRIHQLFENGDSFS